MRLFKGVYNYEIYLDTAPIEYMNIIINSAGVLNQVLVTPATAKKIANHMLKIADKAQANKKKKVNNEK
jgi:hypothetical protein